jgi:hypothetical protein
MSVRQIKILNLLENGVAKRNNKRTNFTRVLKAGSCSANQEILSLYEVECSLPCSQQSVS